MPINAFIKQPNPPGDWVDSCKCVCGAQYKDFICGITFREACQIVRNANQDNNGGYRSRRCILWAMHCYKLSEWFAQHMFCGEYRARAFQAEEERIKEALGDDRVS